MAREASLLQERYGNDIVYKVMERRQTQGLYGEAAMTTNRELWEALFPCSGRPGDTGNAVLSGRVRSQ